MNFWYTGCIDFYSSKKQLVNFTRIHILRKGLDLRICGDIRGGSVEIVHIIRKLVGEVNEMDFEMIDGVW
jgi:hypothetical protein